MKTKMKLMAALGVAAAMFVAGCQHSDKKETAMPSKAAKSVAKVEEASYVTEISFDKGSTTLSAANKRRLASFVDQARKNGKIDDIKVVTWSDVEYPTAQEGKLSKEQRDLATRRNRALKDYLDDVSDGSDIDTYNMASRPGALSRLIRSDDARVKRSLETAGIPTTASTVKVPAKASKSIVMIVMK